jgi:pyridinium-3,5-biscarboxylic acid mononucleotide sulfurtransferase
VVSKSAVVRCRIRRSALVIELDPQSLADLADRDRWPLSEGILALMKAGGALPPAANIRYEAYRVGSAFLNT